MTSLPFQGRPLPTELANPFWHALQGPQRQFGLSTPRAARYRPEFASQAALADFTPAAWGELLTLTGARESVDLFHDGPLEVGEGWERRFEVPLVQLVQERPGGYAPGRPDREGQPEVLGARHVPAMLELIALTKPGPFRERTVELGRYLGVWHGETLIAMAGQRARLTGAAEISGVCTHPDFRRQGHALALVSHLGRELHAEGILPFLHVNAQNTAAIAAYTSLGFRLARETRVSVVRPLAAPDRPPLTAQQKEHS